jgi:hypothetical protein
MHRRCVSYAEASLRSEEAQSLGEAGGDGGCDSGGGATANEPNE